MNWCESEAGGRGRDALMPRALNREQCRQPGSECHHKLSMRVGFESGQEGPISLPVPGRAQPNSSRLFARRVYGKAGASATI
jgi:hypothetical protein